MSDSRTRRKTPWWAYMAWSDPESLAWTYDLYDLYGPEVWPEEFDESVTEGRVAERERDERGGARAGGVFAALGLFPQTVRALAARFRRERAAGATSMAGAESGLALPRSRA